MANQIELRYYTSKKAKALRVFNALVALGDGPMLSRIIKGDLYYIRCWTLNLLALDFIPTAENMGSGIYRVDDK